MLDCFLTPVEARRRINLHALVYDLFIANVENNSSAPSLDVFLRKVFEPVGQSFYSTFDVGFNIRYVSQNRIRAIVEDPPIRKNQKERMRQHYRDSTEEKKLIYDQILYDYTFPNSDTPHLILSLLGEERISLASMDFFTDPIYLGEREHAGSAAGKYCFAGINVVHGMSYTILHEFGHSLGAEHCEDRESVMYPSMIHGRDRYNWDARNKEKMKKRILELGI